MRWPAIMPDMIAFKTPCDDVGSSIAAESPTMNQPGPAACPAIRHVTSAPRLRARGVRPRSCGGVQAGRGASGWAVAAPVRPESYQLTRVSFDGPPPSDWAPPHLLGLTPRARSRGADVTWRMAREAAGPGW